MKTKPGILLVANWDSNVGYAWWLMESFWVVIAQTFRDHDCRLAYPSISKVPEAIRAAPIWLDKLDFTKCDWLSVLVQCLYLLENNTKAIYFTDQALRHWRYAAFRLCGVSSIIVHDHTPGVRTTPSGAKKLLKTLLNKLPFVTADKAIGATEFVRERIKTVGCFPEKKCAAASNGIVSKAHEPASLYDLFRIPSDKAVFVTVARASKYKGIHRALHWLTTAGGNWHYLVCGDGPDLEEFKMLAQTLGISERVTFAGYRADIGSILRACHVAIHPSDGEVGYSLSILECMNAGLPLMVPDNASVRGATTDEDGIIYRSEEDAVRAIRFFLSHPFTRKAMGDQARLRVATEFNLERTHEALKGIFRGELYKEEFGWSRACR